MTAVQVGQRVYVDEGDSIGCREYVGTLEAVRSDGLYLIRTDSGHLRVADPERVDADA